MDFTHFEWLLAILGIPTTAVLSDVIPYQCHHVPVPYWAENNPILLSRCSEESAQSAHGNTLVCFACNRPCGENVVSNSQTATIGLTGDACYYLCGPSAVSLSQNIECYCASCRSCQNARLSRAEDKNNRTLAQLSSSASNCCFSGHHRTAAVMFAVQLLCSLIATSFR